MTNSVSKPPMWFWIVSALALLWNLAGVMAYLGQAYMSIENLEKMSQAERLLYESQPAWVTGAFAVAVWGGALGCIALLLKKKWAKPVCLSCSFLEPTLYSKLKVAIGVVLSS